MNLLAPPIISLNLKDETKQYCRLSSVPLDAIVYEPDQLHAEKIIASKHTNYQEKKRITHKDQEQQYPLLVTSKHR